MFSPDDTIVAVATPPGRGGIGVVRISGANALAIAGAVITHSAALQPRRATFARLAPFSGGAAHGGHKESSVQAHDIGDEVVATFFPLPNSYTGQHVVEISAHGSPVVLRGIVERSLAAGARLAEPGEFTLRAFLNGKRDLVQAEAVADLIDAVTPLQARTAFDQLEGTLTRRIAAIDRSLFDLIAKLEASIDFPDEGYHFIAGAAIAETIGSMVAELDALLLDASSGRMIREGAQVVVIGRPNVGKSSLFNALLKAERAIVTDVPGTTRDLLTERVDIDGLAVTLIDTAGIRDTLDVVEREGVLRTDRARGVADLTLVVLDASEPLTVEDHLLLDRTSEPRRLVVLNKCDLMVNSPPPIDHACAAPIHISATTGLGLEELRRAIARALLGRESVRDTAAISNTRHIGLLEAARNELNSARAAAAAETPEEFVLADLQSARVRFDEVVGRRTSDDVLAHIFERFCIGK